MADTHRSSDNQIITVADAWNRYARRLAAWAIRYLVNRDDVWGGYRPLRTRGTPYLDDAGAPILGKNGKPKLRGAVYTANTGAHHNPNRHIGLDDLTRHFAGLCHGDLRGLLTTSKDGTCLWGLIDIDRHKATTDPVKNRNYAVALYWRVYGLGYRTHLLIDSNGAGGFHLWILFASPRPVADVHWLLKWLVADWQAKGLEETPEVFPKQYDTTSYGARPDGAKKVGNWVRVCGRHHTRDHYSAVLDPNTHTWLHGAEAIARILATIGDSAPIPTGALEYGAAQIAKQQANVARAKAAAVTFGFASETEGYGGDPNDLAALIRSALKAYTNGDLHYDAWLQVGMMVHQAFGGDDEGYEIWCDWSATSTKHTEETCAQKWESFGADGGLTIGTLFHLAKEQGWERPTRQAVPTPKAQSVMAAYNTRKQTEYTDAGSHVSASTHGARPASVVSAQAASGWQPSCQQPVAGTHGADLGSSVSSQAADGSSSEDTNVTTNQRDSDADVSAEEIRRNREAHARAKQHSQLQNWTNGADLDIIAKVYCGWTNTNGDGEGVAADSNLYGLYTAVCTTPKDPDVVNQWCETTVPSHLRAKWLKRWTALLQLLREFGGATEYAVLLANEPYYKHNGVLCHRTADPTQPEPVAKFYCLVTAQIHYTIGDRTSYINRIVATRPGVDGGPEESKPIEVEADKYESLAWIPAQLGPDWPLEVGRDVKQHFRLGVGMLSRAAGIAQYRRYDTTGWHKRDGKDYYVDAGGAIGPEGRAAGFIVNLAHTLPEYKLPDPPVGPQLAEAIKATLELSTLADPDHPNSEGLAAVIESLPWRAVLAPCNFADVFAGPSGGCKTSLGCLVTQHFAPGHAYDSDHQSPIKWEASVAAIEYILHVGADTAVCVENFVADGPKAADMQQKASTILNNQGDLQSRLRMKPDMTQQTNFTPQGALLSTGEDIVARGSARGRSLLVKVTSGDKHAIPPRVGTITFEILTPLQQHAAAGKFAQCMAAYIQHIAKTGLDKYLARLKELTDKRTKDALELDIVGHTRTPGILAAHNAGRQLFLEWVESQGALPAGQTAAELTETNWKALLTLVQDQADQLEESDDALRWRSFIHSAITVGVAYIAGTDGKAPPDRQAECGWHDNDNGTNNHWDAPKPPCSRVGWYDGAYVYLDEHAAMEIAQQYAQRCGARLSSPDTVRERIINKGWLTPATETVTKNGKETKRVRYTHKIRVEGGYRPRAMKLAPQHFWPE